MFNKAICASARPLAPIGADEIPFDLPKSWAWMRLGEVRYSLGQKTPDQDFSYIDVSSINKEEGVISPEIAIVKAEDAPSRARKLVAQGTVILFNGSAQLTQHRAC